jgi:hypothetical protein
LSCDPKHSAYRVERLLNSSARNTIVELPQPTFLRFGIPSFPADARR